MRPIIALDADGVLLDYHEAYRQAWHKAFGILPALKDPRAYWPIDRWDVSRLEGDDLHSFRQCFNLEFWRSVPAIPGAVDACVKLHNAGYDLICVSALEARFQEARLENLNACGFPIERVIATDSAANDNSPKADVLRALQPVAFVDDYLPYLRGIAFPIHTALVLREPNGSPNIGGALMNVHSQHKDLAEFADWWLENRSAQ